MKRSRLRVQSSRLGCRVLSLVVCAALLSLQSLEAAQTQPASAVSAPGTVVAKTNPSRAGFPRQTSSSGPSNRRLYLALGGVAALGVGMIAYGSGDQYRATGSH